MGTDEVVLDQRLLFFSARRLVERVGEVRPTLVVFEDIHWGAPSELDLLEYLGAHIRDTRTVVIALARPELLDTRPSWGGGSAAHTRIPLEPLAAELAAEMAAVLLPAGTDEAALARLVDVAEGNPLFIEELAAALAEGGPNDELPVSVRAAIVAPVDSLPSESRAALLSAAVVGRTFWQEVLRSVSGVDDLHAVLEDLERRDLIRREPTSRLEGDVEFRFKHALIRDVAYGTLPRATRRERHAAIARFVEARADGAESVAWVLAHHRREAGQPEKAVPHLLAAADIAQKAWATEAAVGLYSTAIELSVDSAARARIRLRRGIALVTLGEREQALADLGEVLPNLEGADLLDCLLFAVRAYVWTEQHEEALETAERAVELAARLEDTDGQVAATALLSEALAQRGDEGDIDRAVELGDDALSRWRKGSREYERADHLHLHADLMYWMGNYDRTIELGTAAHELGGDIHSTEALLRGGGIAAMAAAGLGRHEEALAALVTMLDVATGMGHNPRVLLNYSSLVYRELLDLGAARGQSEEALDRSLGLSFGMPRRFAESDLPITSLLEGDVGGAQAKWPKLWEDAQEATGWTRWLIFGRLATARAEIALRTGEPDAVEWGARAVAITTRTRRRKYEARSRALHGEALVALGRKDEGLAELRAAVALSDSLVNPPGRWAARAALTRVLYATGDDDAAALANAEAAEIVRAFASSLSPDWAAALLGAPQVREILIV